MLIVSVGNTRADRKWSVDVGSMYAAFPLGADPGDDRPPPKTFESNFIQHDFVQYRKQHSWYKDILPSIFCHSSVLK